VLFSGEEVIRLRHGRLGRATSALALLTVLTAASPAAVGVYRNNEYGFSVRLPSDKVICRAIPPQHEHGVNILLEGDARSCQEPVPPVARIGAVGSYNASFIKDSETWADVACHDNPDSPGKVGPAPPDLRVKGLDTAGCRIDVTEGKFKGWIIIGLHALAGRYPNPDNRPELRTPSIMYDFTLMTRPERFEADLAYFRAILKTVRIFQSDTEREPSAR
jgi:hypothetical protein